MTDVSMTLTDAGGGELPLGQPLDPFGYNPGMASRIAGLGGSASGHDHTYAFHTPYVEAAAGPCRFTIRFKDLVARRGVLLLRVHMLPLEPGAVARMANHQRVQLNRLVQIGGEITIGFEGFRGFSFAMLGLIVDDTDAQATGLTVTLDRPAIAGDTAGPVPEGRTTAFGRDTARAASHLISAEPPTLADPVSQFATRAQLRESVFRDGRKRLSAAGDDVMQWSNVYVLQVLRRYGVLAAGARGLGLVTGGSPLPAAVATAGADVIAACVDPEIDLDVERRRFLDELDYAEPHVGAAAGERIEVRAADPMEAARNFGDFDFLWSVGACSRVGDAAAVLVTVERLMACLRPGGLAVHVFPADLAAEGNRQNGGETLLARRQIERLALNLISRQNEVAQLRIDRRGAILRVDLPDDEVGAFGLIARRAAAII